MTSAADLRAEVQGRQWYHTLDLGPNVVTPGWFDTRPVAAKLPFPDLTGKRCLDVGTFDGFWAFEMERRGASEVVAIDLVRPDTWDWPADAPEEVVRALVQRKRDGSGFHVAHAALGSKVQWHERSVYDLAPAELGSFDFVYFGSLLLHLRDPVGGLFAAASVCRQDLMVLDAIDPLLTRLHPRLPVASLDGVQRPWWWRPNLAGLIRMIEAAGFRIEQPPVRVRMPRGATQHKPPITAALSRSRAVRRAACDAHFGDPHAAVIARKVTPR
jgi:tRNA (mo5U34)-methyltransferase